MYRLGWFSTGADEAARELLEVVHDSIRGGELEAELAFVFCSRQPGESAESDRFHKLVAGYRIPLAYFSYQKFKSVRGVENPDPAVALPPWRLDYDREVMKRLEEFTPDLCVLAGYMLVVGTEMCRRYNMINLHPAAPGGPVGTWQQVIWQLMESGARQTGVLMNLVTPELDRGPVVTYCTFPIRGGPFNRYWKEIEGQSVDAVREGQGGDNRLFRLIREQGLAREFPLIVATIRAFSQGRVKVIRGQEVVDGQGNPIDGYNLTDEINEVLGRKEKERP